jgi:uncharacterized membrane protein
MQTHARKSSENSERIILFVTSGQKLRRYLYQPKTLAMHAVVIGAIVRGISLDARNISVCQLESVGVNVDRIQILDKFATCNRRIGALHLQITSLTFIVLCTDISISNMVFKFD